MSSRVFYNGTGLLSTDDLRLLAWHELLINKTIVSYTYTYDWERDQWGFIYRPEGGLAPAFSRLRSEMRRATGAFLALGVAFDRRGRSLTDTFRGLAHMVESNTGKEVQ